jgi:hypothetical protein
MSARLSRELIQFRKRTKKRVQKVQRLPMALFAAH